MMGTSFQIDVELLHGIFDNWKRLLRNGIPFGPGGNLPLASLLMVRIA